MDNKVQKSIPAQTPQPTVGVKRDTYKTKMNQQTQAPSLGSPAKSR
jgi:hypothetical protein